MSESTTPLPFPETPSPGKVWLDDLRPAPPGWIWVTWPDEVIALLSTEPIAEISLDHDLGDDARETGYDVLLWIEHRVVDDAHYNPPVIHLHTANPAGRLRMERALASIARWLDKRHHTGDPE